MRFGLPRSPSTSPVRRQNRRSSTFGLQSDSDDSNSASPYSDSDTDSSDNDISSNSFCYESESEVPPPPPKPSREPRDPAEQRYIEETVAAIRLRTRHYDPYEEWEKQTRKDAFRTARKEQTRSRLLRYEQQSQHRTQELQRLAAIHAQQLAEVQKQLASMQLQQQTDVNGLRERWQDQDKRQKDRIEATIRYEEEKVRVRLEAERKVREEEERRKRQEEERRQAEEEERKREEEETRKQREQEESERREKADRIHAEAEGRRLLGMTAADQDWISARETLKNLKAGPMKNVKANKQLKSAWSGLRRQITPKIGQLTTDPQSISRISQQIIEIARPNQPHGQDIYFALLSSLAKAILLQAETEVTAEKKSAVPLAQVTVNLLTSLDCFPAIFFAKLVQRSGGWPIPSTIPATDSDGTAWEVEGERIKAMGYRTSEEGVREGTGEYVARVTGIMRVYFLILVLPVQQPLEKMFQMPRFWTYFARMIGDARLLETAVAAQVLYAGLDVAGLEAKNIWGRQWVKMLELLYMGATQGINGSSDKLLGGQSPEGKAARVRVQLEIERILKAPS
ncbi:hypothetical protein SERLA73DRAFT_96644 [Serpula lacrymans var. lacrymans S7.3]|uniref:mRNA export factor GLE1 n=1 Tax=Serpula lacrymans var. lacrymans (strain S7.3) TaxID=936435 RepID=F8QBA5_SERL3|nr:hypothetical protein SERLA73DRAFT_96644 [Serpula lacrymans var. lacrymans S7.3]